METRELSGAKAGSGIHDDDIVVASISERDMLVGIVGSNIDVELRVEAVIGLDIESVDAEAIDGVIGHLWLQNHVHSDGERGGENEEEKQPAVAAANAAEAAASSSAAGAASVGVVPGNIPVVRRWTEATLILVEHHIVLWLVWIGIHGGIWWWMSGDFGRRIGSPLETEQKKQRKTEALVFCS